MKITEELLMDTRLVRRHIRDGLVEAAAYEKHLSELPDLVDVAQVVDIEMLDVGVRHSEAKDTGEHD
jgi:hypothetical protein